MDDPGEETFIWKKKYEKLGNYDPEEIKKQVRMKLEDNRLELEKLKERRLEAERRREERLKEIEREKREKEINNFDEWASKERDFHVKNTKLRSVKRIKEGRAKTIDLLIRYITLFGQKDEEDEGLHELPLELVEPYEYLNGLRLSDLEDLLTEIKVYKGLDHKENLVYWNDIIVIVEDELRKMITHASSQRSEEINKDIIGDVYSIFKGKSSKELQTLEYNINQKINANKEGVDISYWEDLSSKIKPFISQARLKEFHQVNLREKLENLRKEQDLQLSKEVNSNDSGKEEPESTYRPEMVDQIEIFIEEYENGRYSPPLITSPIEAIVVDPEEDWKALQLQRHKVLNSSLNDGKSTVLMTADEVAFEKEAKRGMGTDENIFRNEAVIVQDKNIASWSNKYEPRKPRYFNRVHTGFEWNKYNQTHYDVDNPPPKIVQGYKFNIFYPDLIDKSKAPTYVVTPCQDNRDFAIIRFKAGPPYEDIAFKIVNREWNYSHKSGFRSQFQNSILQLWFHFKRYRYRR
ncbi:cactin, spliceosome C complex subunit [Brevipalpus obovatus]|uniref:cactin, spliceosome C complex subunit n=1 Tax=Brevipalpus obovatus TaxID=246614 RepID=UPI003D9EE757